MSNAPEKRGGRAPAPGARPAARRDADGPRPRAELRLPALEIRQGPHRVLYTFAVDGKLLPQFTTVSRLHRTDAHALGGYQRPEVNAHIAEIRDYLESSDPMIPNAIVIAFDARVRFEPSPVREICAPYVRHGTLIVPVDPTLTPEAQPGWIVDGQQRTAAIRDADVETFPICATAFITESAHEQREQFILVNATKPLPKALINELLPATEAKLPSALERRKHPALLLDRLNHDEDSPFRGLIKTQTAHQGIVSDTAILGMLDRSLSNGALFRTRGGGKRRVDATVALCKTFWRAVADVFPEAWGKSPRKSRLMHGAGIQTMGFLMDEIAARYPRATGPTYEECVENLRPLRTFCHWTQGEWTFADGTTRRWDKIQNTSNDIGPLVDHVVAYYREHVWSRPVAQAKAAAG